MALTQISTAGVKDDAVTSGKIPANAVGSSELADNAVTTAKITDLNVTADKLASNSVISGKIADGTVTQGKLATDSVSTAKILNSAVDSTKLAVNSVITSKIADDAVNAAKIADSAVTGPKIADGTIGAVKLGSNVVTTAKIADDAVTDAKLAAGSVGTAALADNAIITSKLNNSSVTNDKIHQMAASKLTGALPAIDGSNLTGISSAGTAHNLIINGAMQIAQRGTSSTTSGMHTIDRWTCNWSGGGVTQAQVSEQSGTAFENGFNNYLRLTNTSNTTTDTDYRFIGQTIEAQNVANSGWNFKSSSSYVTFSFWVRSSLAGTYYGWLNSRDGTAKTHTFSFTLSANTWTKVTKTISGNSGIDIHNNNDEGLLVHIIPWYGTYYTTSGHTLNAWQTSDSTNRTPDYSQNWANTSNATFDLTGVQLEVGNSATDFEQKTFAEDILECWRYFYKTYDYNTAIGTATSVGAFVYSLPGSQTYAAMPSVRYPVEMRDNPTVTAYSTQNANTTGKMSADATDKTTAITYIGRKGHFPFVNNSSSGMSVNVWLRHQFTAVSEI